MKRYGRLGVQAAALALLALCAGGPALAFELFGFRLWGSDEKEADRIEIIDPLPYTVEVRVTGDGDLQKTVENASSLWLQREQPAAGKGGLLSRGRGDYRRILAALYNSGYYGGSISITAAGAEVADLTLAAEFPTSVPMVITVDPGPIFRFGAAGFVNPPTFQQVYGDEVAGPATVGFESGEPAEATVIGAASALAVEQWRQLGHAKAREAGRDVIADHRTNEVDVTITLEPDRVAFFGPVSVNGSQRVDPAFIEYMTGLEMGVEYDPDTVDAARERLSRLGVFRSIRIEEGDELGPDGILPFTVTVEDRRPRTFGFGGTYSTIDGLGVEAYWMHRNLFGRAERLRFNATIEQLLVSTDPSEYNYNFGVSFTKPGVYRPDNDFVAGAVARQLDLENYWERSISGQIGFSRRFGQGVNADLFLTASRSRFEDDFGTRDFTIVSVLGRGEFDRRRVDRLNAIGGYYLAGEAQPLYEAVYGNPALLATVEGRKYYAVDEDARFVLAGRARLGAFFGPPPEESPPNLLFFAGGGGSVRGYAYRSIGVEIPDVNGQDGVVGGAGLLETSGEIRVRLNESFGAVGFLDVGYVTESADFSGVTDLRAGAGLGVRYFTSIGPLRADLAAPLNPRPEDAPVALYIGIGQAF